MTNKNDWEKPALRVVSDNAADPLFTDYGPVIGINRVAASPRR